MGASRTRIIEQRWWALRHLWWIGVVARLVVAGVLVVGPATDEPAELAGWDAERFQAIAERSGPAWADEPVEYPPGSVVVLDRLAGADVVDTHRRLVTLSVVVDLAMAALLWRRVGSDAGRWFLVLGLPLVPLGYQRLDTLVTAVALVGALAMLTSAGPAGGTPDRGATGDDPSDRLARRRAADVVAGLALAAGALIKLWPAVLAVAAVAIARWRALAVATVAGGLGGGLWLATAGVGLDPLDQVLSLRGAAGWHVESLPGALVALLGSGEAALELNAYRIGELRPGVVTAGRLLAVGAMIALAVAGRRAHRSVGSEHRSIVIVGLTALGATGALLATAPLLSPQFLVWTTPWAALVLAAPEADRLAVATSAMAGAAGLLTGFTLTVFRPDGLTGTVPAALLTARNGLLLTIPVVAALALGRLAADRTDPTTGQQPVSPSGATASASDRTGGSGPSRTSR